MRDVLLENLLHEDECFSKGGLVAFMSRNDSHNANVAIRVADKYVESIGKACLYFSLRLERKDFYGLEGKLDYVLDDTAGIEIDVMIDEIKETSRMLNVGLVVIDTLPLIRGHRKESRREEVLEILSLLYEVANELSICILALLPTGRAVEKGNEYPVKGELRQYHDNAGEFIGNLYFVMNDSVKEFNELL